MDFDFRGFFFIIVIAAAFLGWCIIEGVIWLFNHLEFTIN